MDKELDRKGRSLEGEEGAVYRMIWSEEVADYPVKWNNGQLQ